MDSLRKLHIFAGVLDIRFVQDRRQRIRQDLIDASSRHDIAAKKYRDGPSFVHLIAPADRHNFKQVPYRSSLWLVACKEKRKEAAKHELGLRETQRTELQPWRRFWI
jgi:hypothetical protein